jgi:hypothetical protein
MVIMGQAEVSEETATENYYIVWNAARTEGFVTTDHALAYEVRKSASSNCSTSWGGQSEVAKAFCERWYLDVCTIETLTQPAGTARKNLTDQIVGLRAHEMNFDTNIPEAWEKELRANCESLSDEALHWVYDEVSSRVKKTHEAG